MKPTGDSHFPKATCLFTALHHHQVLADDDLALEVLRHRGTPGLIVDADWGSEVRKHECFDPCFLGDAADIFRALSM